MKKLIAFVFVISFLPTLNSHDLEAAIGSEERSPKNITRDSSRHPYETLTFFEIEPNMKVVELSPGGGWYTEILANYIHKPGKLIAAHFDKDSQRAYFQRSRASFEKRIDEDPLFKDIEIVDLSSSLAEPGSIDAVLTFRNLHNWLGPQMDSIFANSSKALKSGGLFGVVEHRAKPGTSMEMMKKSGYVTEEHAIAVAKKHGFTLVARSEINSNPKDSASYPGGVWTLPPSLRLKDKDREKYIKIGESDRMTLLFKKS
tara:strand:+ start:20 stop:793 length:774 start_codon:yes stop_codon:yes gene_type:complete